MWHAPPSSWSFFVKSGNPRLINCNPRAAGWLFNLPLCPLPERCRPFPLRQQQSPIAHAPMPQTSKAPAYSGEGKLLQEHRSPSRQFPPAYLRLSFAATKRNSAFGSRKRRISQQVAVRLTRICSRVTHSLVASNILPWHLRSCPIRLGKRSYK